MGNATPPPVLNHVRRSQSHIAWRSQQRTGERDAAFLSSAKLAKSWKPAKKIVSSSGSSLFHRFTTLMARIGMDLLNPGFLTQFWKLAGPFAVDSKPHDKNPKFDQHAKRDSFPHIPPQSNQSFAAVNQLTFFPEWWSCLLFYNMTTAWNTDISAVSVGQERVGEGLA